MFITKTNLFKGCLIASISHAIMTNIYTELSYEQSWDGFNYSIQSSDGLRGTITFAPNYCVAAIRNDKLYNSYDGELINEIIKEFPYDIINKFNSKTLQYMLVKKNGLIIPSVTSVFWANDFSFNYNKENLTNLKCDLVLLSKNILSEEEIIDYWVSYYNMDINSIRLLRYLYNKKATDFNTPILLTIEQQKLIPGDNINFECIDSLNELNIYLSQ